jgi:hypothetical protein
MSPATGSVRLPLSPHDRGTPAVYLDWRRRPEASVLTRCAFTSGRTPTSTADPHWRRRRSFTREPGTGCGVSAPGSERRSLHEGDDEAINIVVHTGRGGPVEGDEILLEMEHHSNLVPWILLARERKLRLRHVPVTDEGILDLPAFERLLTRRTRLVALAHVSNVLGTINPVAEIVERAQAAGARVLLDGAQAAPHLPVDVAALGVFSGLGALGAPASACSRRRECWAAGAVLRERIIREVSARPRDLERSPA